MNDRELLEAAAKAAGMDYLVWTPGLAPIVPVEHRIGDRLCWNPLNDDGDALRLAVKLRMNIEPMNTLVGRDRVGWNVWPSGRGDCAATSDGNDIADLRRAIVRAAAAIGKQS